MSEPWLPLPPLEEDSYDDPHPARCPVEGCLVILTTTHWTNEGDFGNCPYHGYVKAVYFYSDSPDPENDE